MWKQVWKHLPFDPADVVVDRRCYLLRASSWLGEAEADGQRPFSPFHWILEGGSCARPPAEWKWGQQCILCNQQKVRVKDVLALRAARPWDWPCLRLECFFLFPSGTLLSGLLCIHQQTTNHCHVALGVFPYRGNHTDELCLSRNVKLPPPNINKWL